MIEWMRPNVLMLSLEVVSARKCSLERSIKAGKVRSLTWSFNWKQSIRGLRITSKMGHCLRLCLTASLIGKMGSCPSSPRIIMKPS